jgi:hypothetical protein
MTWEVPELRIKNNYSMDGVIMGVPYKGKGQSFFNCSKSLKQGNENIFFKKGVWKNGKSIFPAENP